jgi:hypothetical protein
VYIPGSTRGHRRPGCTARPAGGSAGPLVYPSIVNVRLVHAETALERAVEFADG